MLLTSACLATGAADAKPAQRYGVFVYSDECISEMSSDAYGLKVTLWRNKGWDRMLYELNDGLPGGQMIQPLTIDPKTGNFSFELKQDDAPSPLPQVGKLSADGSRLVLTGPIFGEREVTHVLKRITDFSRPIPFCK